MTKDGGPPDRTQGWITQPIGWILHFLKIMVSVGINSIYLWTSTLRLLQRSSSWLGLEFVLFRSLAGPCKGQVWENWPFFMFKNAPQIWFRLKLLVLRIAFGACSRISSGGPRSFAGARFKLPPLFSSFRVSVFSCSKQALNLALTCLFLNWEKFTLEEGRVFILAALKIFTGARFGDWVAVGLRGSFGNLDSESNAVDLESWFRFFKTVKLQRRICNLIYENRLLMKSVVYQISLILVGWRCWICNFLSNFNKVLKIE